MKELQGRRDSVLDRAALQLGDVVLDVGCGDGLIGFGALDLVGPGGQVIFSDISSNLVERCRAIAENPNFPSPSGGGQGGGPLLDRCRFIVNSADDLRDISDRSVDLVTTRSVLIYVDRKDRAFAEFFRVLRPGGRISLGEPINRFSYPEPRGRFLGYDVTPVVEIADKLEAFFDREERPKISAMMDFDERDLIAIAERTGFGGIHLDLQADIKAPRAEDWNRFVHSAGNPLSPTLGSDARVARSSRARPFHRTSQAAGRVGDRHGTSCLRVPLGGETGSVTPDPPEVRRLKGAHVNLRRFRPTDEATVWEGRASAEPAALPTGPGPRSRLRKRILASGQWVRGSLDLAIESNGRLIGDVQARMGVGQRLPPGVVELGVDLYDPGQRGKGYGAEAVALLTTWLLERGIAERVLASTAVGNRPMRRVLEKLGFTFEGVMRGFMPVGGGREDFALYGVTKAEWRSIGAKPVAEPQ